MLGAVDAWVACRQFHSQAANNQGPARVLHAVVALALAADAHCSMALMRQAQLLLFKFPRLKLVFDAEGVLFSANGSLQDDTLSLHWHKQALRHHVSPVAQMCKGALETALSKAPRTGAMDAFAQLIPRGAEWLEAENPGQSHRDLWPWTFVDPPAIMPVAEKLPKSLPFVTEADLLRRV